MTNHIHLMLELGMYVVTISLLMNRSASGICGQTAKALIS